MCSFGLIDEFLEGTRKVLESFFELQVLAMEKFTSSDKGAGEEVFQKVIHTNKQLISSFLELQQSAFVGVNRTGHSGLPAAGGANDVERWLYSTIVDLTGCPSDRVTPQSMLEDDLGLDSITLVEIFFKLADAFPQFQELEGELRDCETVGDVLRLLERNSTQALSDSHNLNSPGNAMSPTKEVYHRASRDESSGLHHQDWQAPAWDTA